LDEWQRRIQRATIRVHGWHTREDRKREREEERETGKERGRGDM
jgi:hypothetical protein